MQAAFPRAESGAAWMPWDETADILTNDRSIDRLSLAAPLLGATGWIDMLARLVAVDTASPEGRGCETFCDTLRDLFAPLGFGLRRLEVPEALRPEGARSPVISLLGARRIGRPACTIHLPMDTAAVGTGWTREPLALARQGNRLYGLGTTRCKGAIAALWAALRAADAVGLGLRHDLVLAFTADYGEQRHSGLRHMATQGVLEGHLLALDGLAAPQVWAGALGALEYEIRINPGPALRCSPAEAAGPVLSRLMALREDVAGRHSTIPAPPEREGEPLLRPSLRIVSVRAGDGRRGGLPSCAITVMRRFTAEEGHHTAMAELNAALDGAQDGVTLTGRVLRHMEPVAEPDRGAHAGRWQQALGWGFGFRQEAFRRWGSLSPSPLGFVQQAGLGEILTGGLSRRGQLPQAPDEFTTIEDVEALGRSLLAYLADLPVIPLD